MKTAIKIILFLFVVLNFNMASAEWTKLDNDRFVKQEAPVSLRKVKDKIKIIKNRLTNMQTDIDKGCSSVLPKYRDCCGQGVERLKQRLDRELANLAEFEGIVKELEQVK